MSRRAVITGLGFITSIGNDRAAVTRSLRELRHGFERIEFLNNPTIPVKVAGTIKDFTTTSPEWRDWRWPSGYDVPRELLRGLAPHGLYAFCAIEQALNQAKLERPQLDNADTGLFCASAGSPQLLHHFLDQMRTSRGERGNPLGIVSSIAGTLNFNFAAHYKIRGAVCGYVSACASSSHALGYAFDEIRLGRQRRMIVVGAEDLSAESVLPFAAMRALSNNSDPAAASRPFDQRRDGFVTSGGAVAMILEEYETAAARGAPILGEFLGWGQAGDGYNVAISHPEGAGLREAMTRALADAKLSPGQIGYINAHATSTPAGDRSEALAINALFTSVGAWPRVSSTKALTGHGLSMSGIMETAFCTLALTHKFIPGCAHLNNPDPACEGLDLPRATLDTPPGIILKNSSGFGGSNVCLVLGPKQT